MEEKIVKILEALEQKQGGPFEWSVEIDGEKKKLSSWEKRELDNGETYQITLLDEDPKSDVTYNQRRMSKKHKPVKLVEGGVEDNESTEVVEKAPTSKPTKKVATKPKPPVEDDFDELYGDLLEDKDTADKIDANNAVTKKAVTKPKQTALVIPTGAKLELTPVNVKKYLCPLGTDTEIMMFLQNCINQQMDPFIGDAYLIKYSPNAKASMVVSKDFFMKRAEKHESYQGIEAGIVVFNKTTKELIRRQGSMILKEEDIIGGHAKIFREGMQPFYAEVSFEEYNTDKAMWKTKPGTMIRKVAIVQAMREAFPTSFQGLYDRAEIDVEGQQ